MKKSNKILIGVGIALTTIVVVGIYAMIYVLFFGLPGPGDKSIYSEDRKMRKVETQSARYAVKYIKQKYGFEPNVVSIDAKYSEVQDLYDFFVGHGFLYDAVITMEYKGNTFEVYNSSDTTSLNFFYDNYQEEEIKQAVYDYYLKRFDNLKPDSYSISLFFLGYKNQRSRPGFHIHEFYDGTSIEDLIVNNHISIHFEYNNIENFKDLFDMDINTLPAAVFVYNNRDIEDKDTEYYEYFDDTKHYTRFNYVDGKTNYIENTYERNNS